MIIGWIYKDERWYVASCPELGVASQGKTRKAAYAILAETVELWLEAASAKEIKRGLIVKRFNRFCISCPVAGEKRGLVPNFIVGEFH